MGSLLRVKGIDVFKKMLAVLKAPARYQHDSTGATVRACSTSIGLNALN